MSPSTIIGICTILVACTAVYIAHKQTRITKEQKEIQKKSAADQADFLKKQEDFRIKEKIEKMYQDAAELRKLSNKFSLFSKEGYNGDNYQLAEKIFKFAELFTRISFYNETYFNKSKKLALSTDTMKVFFDKYMKNVASLKKSLPSQDASLIKDFESLSTYSNDIIDAIILLNPDSCSFSPSSASPLSKDNGAKSAE